MTYDEGLTGDDEQDAILGGAVIGGLIGGSTGVGIGAAVGAAGSDASGSANRNTTTGSPRKRNNKDKEASAGKDDTADTQRKTA